jgi:hypothetical protein
MGCAALEPHLGHDFKLHHYGKGVFIDTSKEIGPHGRNQTPGL